ncbi:hypothetical protein PCE1_002508 [Barthelona sp. PCE]
MSDDEERDCIPSGTIIDDILDGGFEKAMISEVFGPAGAGKSQLLHCCAVSCIRNGHGAVLWLDTEGCFSTSRIEELCENEGINAEDILPNIIVARSYTSDHQLEVIEHAYKMMANGGFGCFFIDSLTHLLRTEYSKEELFERQTVLSRMFRRLREVSIKHDVCVVYTNQIRSVFKEEDGTLGFTAIGGNILKHSATVRVLLTKTTKNRQARIFDAPHLPDVSIDYRITAQGMVQV